MNKIFFTSKDHKRYELLDVQRYLNIYKNHSIKVIRPKTFDYDKLFFTEHTYDDGLSIRLKWFTEVETVEASFKSIKQLFSLRNKYIIILRGFEILSLNKFTNKKNNRELEKVQFINEKMYQQLEYKINSSPKLPNSLFDDFIKKVNNKIEFEKYYKEYTKNKISKTNIN